MLSLSPDMARRLAITRQRLAGPRPRSVLEVVSDLGCLQLDPISVVAPSPQLVLWSRLGLYSPSELDTLLFKERRLFEYWAHAASIVLTEDYPIHRLMMRSYATGNSPRAQRIRAWIDANRLLRRHVRAELRRRGPLRARQLEDRSERPWSSSGWTAGRNVDRMLAFLWFKGEVMVAGRAGGEKLWDLAERCLPVWTPRDSLGPKAVVRLSAQRSLRALGVARRAHIEQHFIRGSYPGLPGVLSQLQREGRIMPVEIRDGGEAWPGHWYVHVDDLPLLERLTAGDWEPRTTLLSPFDNLICDRARTRTLFGFDFKMEIYVPAAERLHGYYVLPILLGDRLVGRLDPVMDRKMKRLTIRAAYAEPDALHPAVGTAVGEAVRDLARFLGATQISYGPRLPDAWRRTIDP